MKKLLLSLTLIGALYALKPIERHVLNLPKQPLSKQEIKELKRLREEEKVARDAYYTFYKIYHLPIFLNIAKNESWHMHMVKLLLNKYELDDPALSTGDKVGVFKSKEMQKMYNQMVKEGSKSIKDALFTAAKSEDLDIYDLNKAIKNSDNKDIKFVYTTLKHGSEYHLKDFVGILKDFGVNYTPRYISKAYFKRIMATSFSKFHLTKMQGEVKKVYIIPGLIKGVYWWAANVKTNNGIFRVAIAPTWLLKKINIKPKDKVEIEGYQGLYSFIVCDMEDKDTKFKYKSKSPKCRE
jgi:hypothetical protein